MAQHSSALGRAWAFAMKTHSALVKRVLIHPNPALPSWWDAGLRPGSIAPDGSVAALTPGHVPWAHSGAVAAASPRCLHSSHLFALLSKGKGPASQLGYPGNLVPRNKHPGLAPGKDPNRATNMGSALRHCPASQGKASLLWEELICWLHST